ncbi:MAG: hypothetical protein V4655_07045 [Bdellovibrionota bacterium]
MKLFGQFLIEQGYITKEDYVRAMVFQANALPALPSVINQLKLLTIDQQVEIFDHQSTHLKTYQLACIELGYWDEAVFDHAVIRFFLNHVRSLGDILLELGCLTSASLSEVLAKYVELGDYKPASEPKEIPKATSGEHKHSMTEQTGPSKDPFVLSQFEKKVCFLYCRHFNDQHYEALLRLSSHISQEELTHARRDLTAIRTASTLIRADKSHLLLDSLLKIIEHGITPSLDSPSIKHTVNLLWELREGLSAGIPEALALQNKELLNQVNDALASLSKIG